MTEEEHIARAMLLGMSYHHGNGEPFYYTAGEDGKPVRMIDADTLKPIPNHKDDGVGRHRHAHGWMVRPAGSHH